jgi:hypothetical protein
LRNCHLMQRERWRERPRGRQRSKGEAAALGGSLHGGHETPPRGWMEGMEQEGIVDRLLITVTAGSSSRF